MTAGNLKIEFADDPPGKAVTPPSTSATNT